MKNIIKCPHCQKNIAIDQALRQQFETQARDNLKKEYEEKLKTAREQAKDRLERKIRSQLELEMRNKSEELKELRDEKRKLAKQFLELNKSFRLLREKDEMRQLELEKKLAQEKERTKSELEKRFESEHKLKLAEKQEQIESMKRVIKDLQRKSEQGSMQTQGEALEVSFEQSLRKEFPQDTIAPVEKGIKGADIAQTVRSPRGVACGTILWETKRTKAFSLSWISKLKADLRRTRAHIPALISQTLPDRSRRGILLKEGVWIANFEHALALARLLRERLLAVGREKAVHAHARGKANAIYNYLTSHEFQQQVEAMVEVYQEMNQQIDKERIVFEKQWKTRQMQVHKLFSSVGNVYGAIQGIAGSSIPQVKGLELESLTDPQQDKLPPPKPSQRKKTPDKSPGASQKSLL